MVNSASPLPFFHLLERLKTTKREGWRRFGINHGESIADHMYRMSILTMLCPPALSARLDLNRCIRMCLIHDAAESLVGDITPVDGVLKTEKSRREAETMDYMCTSLLGHVDGGRQGEQIREVWQEYEDSETLESNFVHDVDKMELLLQMKEYESAHQGRIDLAEFSWYVRSTHFLMVQKLAFLIANFKRATAVSALLSDINCRADVLNAGSPSASFSQRSKPGPQSCSRSGRRSG